MKLRFEFLFLVRLQDDIRNKIVPTRKSLIELASQLNGLKDIILTEKKNFDTELETISKLLVRFQFYF